MREAFDYGIHYRSFHDNTIEHANHHAEHFLQTHGRWLPNHKEITALDLGCGMGFAMLGLKRRAIAMFAALTLIVRRLRLVSARD